MATLVTQLAMDMVFTAVAPTEPKRKSQKAVSFYEEPPVEMPMKKRRRAAPYMLKTRDAMGLFVVAGHALPMTEDGRLYAVEFICVLTKQSRACALRKMERLDPRWFQDCVVNSRVIKVISFSDALVATMVMPGKIAGAMRLEFGSSIARYLTVACPDYDEIESSEKPFEDDGLVTDEGVYPDGAVRDSSGAFL
jgi:hypothetical protein